jgi:response regulator NasT
VDRAKAVLQTERGMTEPEAFRYVQRRSMDERRSMRAIAQEVLEESDKAARPSPG